MPRSTKSTFPPDPVYPPKLKTPVVLEHSFLKSVNDVVFLVHKDEIAKAYREKLHELADFHGVDLTKPNAFEILMLRLAMAHVPGFKIRLQRINRGGRPPKNTSDFQRKLLDTVAAERANNPELTLEKIFEDLTKPNRPFQEYSSSGLKTRYAEARSAAQKEALQMEADVQILLNDIFGAKRGE